MSAGPVVVIGAGDVGCGVLAAALQARRLPYVMVTRTEETAARLCAGAMRVRSDTSPEAEGLVLRPTFALSVEHRALPAVIRDASAVFVTVGSGRARMLAPWLGAALARRSSSVPVLVCDNNEGAPDALRCLVAEHDLRSGSRHRFAGVMVDRIVNHTQEPGGTIFVAEAAGDLYVDRPALGGTVPDLVGLVGVDRFRSHLTRKRFVFNAGHAATAYLGGLAGHRTLPDALADDDVLSLVRAAMREGQAGIAAACGDDFAGGPTEVEAAIGRFGNPALADTVVRVGRDPLRKLGKDERICGPARLAQAAGTSTRALAVTAAAAVWWGASLDPALLTRRARLGPRRLVASLACLGPHDPFVEQVSLAVRVMSEGGDPVTAFEDMGGELLAESGSPR